MSNYYIVSSRIPNLSPAHGCFAEFEDVLVDCCEGTLIVPTLSDTNSRLGRYIKRFINSTQLDIAQTDDVSGEKVLILVCSSIWDCQVLDYIPKWRIRFDVVCAYIFDSFLPPEGLANWRFSRFRKLVNSLDYLFIPMTGSLQQFAETFRVPVAMIPMACDVIKFGSHNDERYIDLMGYGRQLTAHSLIFEQAYNNPQSKRTYYYTSHMHIGKVHDLYGYRRLFWKLLSHSQIALAYDVLTANSLDNRFKFSFVAQRWFECLTAGCLVVGRRPTCSEADQLLNWEDVTIDLPDDEADLVPFVESLLANEQRLRSAHRRNYFNALARHDWRYRIAEILNYLGLNQPVSLQQALSDLRQKCEVFKNTEV